MHFFCSNFSVMASFRYVWSFLFFLWVTNIIYNNQCYKVFAVRRYLFSVNTIFSLMTDIAYFIVRNFLETKFYDFAIFWQIREDLEPRTIWFGSIRKVNSLEINNGRKGFFFRKIFFSPKASIYNISAFSLAPP